MPTKFSTQRWQQVRERTEHLVSQGHAPESAARIVSAELDGKPAPGTILNRHRIGWRKPGTPRKTTPGDMALQDQLTEAHDTIRELRAELDKATAELEAAQDALVHAQTERARAEGAAEVLREVVNVEPSGPTNAHGFPAI